MSIRSLLSNKKVWIPLVVLCVFTCLIGLARVSTWLTVRHYTAQAAEQNAHNSTYNILDVACNNGYHIAVEGKKHFYVFKGFSEIGYYYELKQQTWSELVLTTPQGHQSFTLTGPTTNQSLSHTLPYVPSSERYIFQAHQGSPTNIGFELNQLDNHQSGIANSLRFIAVASTTFSDQDFTSFTSCLTTYQSEHGPIKNLAADLQNVWGMFYDKHARYLDLTSLGNSFACSSGPTVAIDSAYYIALVDSKTGLRGNRIGKINNDLSTQALSSQEQAQVGQEGGGTTLPWLHAYQQAVSCLASGTDCPESVSVVYTNTAGQRASEYRTRAQDPEGYIRSLEFTKSYYSQKFASYGLTASLPSNFNQCVNSKHQTIRDFILAGR